MEIPRNGSSGVVFASSWSAAAEFVRDERPDQVDEPGSGRSPIDGAGSSARFCQGATLTPAQMHIREPYRAYESRIRELHRGPDADGVILHSGRNLIRRMTIGGPPGESIEAVVKAFAVPARPRGFVYARLRPSKAWRSLVHAEKLLALGIGTPDPIACIEYEDAACLRESYYLSRYWPPDVDLTAVLYRGGSLGERTNALLEQLARFTCHQHDNGVLHRDYNPGNILVRIRGKRFEFALVDLNRLRFDLPGADDRMSALVRLTTSVDYLRIIGRQYADLIGVDSTDFCRKLERALVRFRARRRTMNRIKSWLRREN